MKKYLSIAVVTASLLQPVFASEKYVTQDEFDEALELLDKIETKVFSNKINWSIDLRGRVDNFKYKMNGIGDNIGKPYDPNAPINERREMAYPQTEEWDPHYSVRGYLNMKAKLEDISFTGRIRFDHSSQTNQRLCILAPQDIGNDLLAVSSNKFTSFEVDKAYFDLPLFKQSKLPLIISSGILPTSGGMSSNIIENHPRGSVFPSLIFDSNVYGGILTANLSKITGLSNAYVRLVAGKAYTLNDENFYYQCNREIVRNMDVAGLFFEFKVPVAWNNLFWIGINKNSNIKAIPFLGSSNVENKGSNTALKYLKPLGDITNYGVGIEFRKISLASGKLDFFLHSAVSDPSPNGNCVNYTDVDDPTCSVGGEANPNPFYHSEMGRGTLLKKKGHSIYTGFRYEIPAKLKTKIGYEFNYGSKYWWSATQGSEDVFNKLATRGNVNEFYLIQPINRHLYFRLGYLSIKEKYSGSGWHFGTPLKKDAKQENLYMLFNAYF